MAKSLSDDEKNWVINDTFNSLDIDETLKKISMTRKEFSEYLDENPEFSKAYDKAMIDACKFIENDMLNLHKGKWTKGVKEKADAKLARVRLEAMRKILEYRNPAKYSPKFDVSVSATISIRASIERANERLAEVMRDVTPLLVAKK